MRSDSMASGDRGLSLNRRRATGAGRRHLRAGMALAAAATCVATGLVTAGPAAAADCSDVELVFARGTGERPGLGILGAPLVREMQAALPGKTVTSRAVDYAAAANQRSAGPGATDMTNHVVETAAACPNTTFVLGGYSQGASVTDIALGVRTNLGNGQSIPTNLAPRVGAVVVFGNPLGLSRQTIEQSSDLYGDKAKSFCANGDPVCGGGNNFAAHLAYSRNGNIGEAADFVASTLGTGGGSGAGAGSGGQAAQPPAASTPPQQTERRSFWRRVLSRFR